ncbi:MAG: hypothetical protein JRJ00_07310, partial [Deltaproteobacteria bacterium]|nr:hypothetical protein [Deltaproteobacteria bacterium]
AGSGEKGYRDGKGKEAMFNTILSIAIDLQGNILACDIENIRITGGEPLLRESIVELIESLSSIIDLQELSLSTDGILLANYAHPLKETGLKKYR